MRCPLCGMDFEESDLSCHRSCPLASLQGCRLLCCPNCGYQMVDERKSGVARWLRRWIKAPEDSSRTGRSGE